MAPGRTGNERVFRAPARRAARRFQLVIDYVKQETLDPLKGLGRFILFGVAGSVALPLGLVVLAVGPAPGAPGRDRDHLRRQSVLGPLCDLRRRRSIGGRRRCRVAIGRGQARVRLERDKETA